MIIDTDTGAKVAVLHGHSGLVTSAAFSPDGLRVVTAASDGTARVHVCEVCRPIEELIELARGGLTREFTPEERSRFLGRNRK